MAITFQGWMRFLSGGLFNPDRGRQYSGPDKPATDAGITVTDDLAITIGAVFRCIRIISEVGALLPMCGYRRLANGDREELPPDHWLQRLINQPNEVMSGSQWAQAMYAQDAGWGNAFTQIVPNFAGRPVELWPYKVDRMRVSREPDHTVKYQYPDANGRLLDLDPKRVGHMRGFTIDGVMGISPLGLARNAAGLALQAERYAGSFFAAGGRPAGVLTSDRILTKDQRDKIQMEYGSMADATTGKRLWLLEASLKYQAITVNPEDMEMLMTRSFQVAEIARFFGVPLFLLFETEKSTSWGSGIEQQNNALKNYTLAPFTQDMTDLWNHSIIPPKDRAELFVDVDLEALDLADYTARGTFYTNMTQNGVLKRNEARRKLKLARDPNPMADQLTVQSQMVPLATIKAAQQGGGQNQPPPAQ